MPPTLPPYAIAAPAFRFRHLAALAGRAPIGGAREVALACFVAARLAVESGAPEQDADTRATRAAAARTWLGTLALPTAVKTPVMRCAEASGHGAAPAVAKEVTSVAAAAATYLDAPSRAELEALAASLRS